jgi:hypothetical protein
MLPQAARNVLLEAAHGRVLTPHVIADLRARHRGAHPLIGEGQRVTSEIDYARH